MTDDIRWQQRLQSYQKALSRLQFAVDLSRERPLSDLEQQGLIQTFEFTHELAWNVMKDYLRSLGQETLMASRDSTRAAFAAGLIHSGEAWMDMMASRNLSSYTYNDDTAQLIANKAADTYLSLFVDFSKRMQIIADDAGA